MRVLRGILTVLIPLLLFAAGVGLVWLHVRNGDTLPAEVWEAVLNPLSRLLFGVLLIILALGWTASFLSVDARHRYVTFENSGGEVRVSLAAISDFLARLSMEFPWLVSVRPEVIVRDGSLAVDMHCRIRSGSPIPTVSRGLQDRVREAVRQTIGLSEVATVRITVREIVGSPPASVGNGLQGESEFDADPRVAGWSNVSDEQSSPK